MKYLFSPSFDEIIHEWPRNGDIVEIVKPVNLHYDIESKYVIVRPHSSTKYPYIRASVVLATSLQEIKN